jgi:hypothetical protein
VLGHPTEIAISFLKLYNSTKTLLKWIIAKLLSKTLFAILMLVFLKASELPVRLGASPARLYKAASQVALLTR